MDYNKFQEHMKQRRQEMKRFGKTTKFKPGKNRIRILHGWRVGEEHIWYHDFAQHFVKDAAGQLQAVYMCTHGTYKTPCGVCAAMNAANKLVHDDATQKVMEDAAANRVVLVNALMLDSSEPNTPVILELKKKLYDQIDGMFQQYGPELFFDLNKGHEIIVDRQGVNLNTTYTAMPTMQPGAAIPEAVLTKLNNLDEYVAQQSEAKEKAAIAAVNSIVGLVAGHVPSTTATAALAGPSAPVTQPIGMGTATTAATAPAAPAVNQPSLDDSLDDLLSDIVPASATA